MINPFDNKEIASYNVTTFGNSVRKRREDLGISVREMARRVGMSPVYLSGIERGIRPAPSGVNSGIDYMSILADKLCLTDEQKETYMLMAKFSHLNAMSFMDKYFIANPYALKFCLKAMGNNMTSADWKKMYDLIFG